MRQTLVVVVAIVALAAAFMAGTSAARRECVSAPVGGYVATWCGDDVPAPSSF